jgi:hypothetical protein
MLELSLGSRPTQTEPDSSSRQQPACKALSVGGSHRNAQGTAPGASGIQDSYRLREQHFGMRSPARSTR